MKRIYMTMDEKLIRRFDGACEKTGLNRSQYLSCLLAGRLDLRPPVLKYKEMISALSEIERDLKVIAMKDSLSDNDRILIFAKLSDIKELLSGEFTKKEVKDETEG